AAEDHDVVWRALRAGYSGCFEPEAVVSHRQWRSRREQLRTYYGYGVGSGALAMKRWRMRDAGLQSHSVSRLGTLRQGMGDIVWPHGVIGPMKSIRNGYEMGVLVELAMLAGGIQGMMAARTTALCRERFSRSDQQGIAR
ncbi:MAG: glycosyltransferase family 2 protein, partial [Acidimicrobiales bacterium]